MATKTRKPTETVETPIITSAQLHCWFYSFIKLAGISEKTICSLDETVSFVWSRMIEHLSMARTASSIFFVGSPLKMISFCELKDIMQEFELYKLHPENGKTLSSLIEWVGIQTNALLNHRKVKKV